MKNIKMYICFVAAAILLGTAALCCIKIYSHYQQINEQAEEFEVLAHTVTNHSLSTIDENEATEEKEVVLLADGENVLKEYSKLYLENPDIIGWIKIADTNINYPVMQTPSNANFYLKHNFKREYSDLGVPYVQENCVVGESDNLIIYGHHIKNKKMFGALEDYEAEIFYKDHKTIQFDMLSEHGKYEIIAVFKTVAYSSDGFRYYDFIKAENVDEYNAYVNKCKTLSLYDIDATAQYGDSLITLSTCEYSAQNGRLVIVAKKIN